MSHYFAQEMFSQVLVSPTLPYPYNSLKVSIVSENLQPMFATLLVKIQRWDELNTFHTQNVSVRLESQSVFDMDLDLTELQQFGRCHGSDSTKLRFEYCFITLQ